MPKTQDPGNGMEYREHPPETTTPCREQTGDTPRKGGSAGPHDKT